MLLSRANLSAVDLASRDAKDPVLHQLRVEADGTTVASDGSVLMAVSPVVERPPAFPEFPGEETAAACSQEEGGFGISPGMVRQARRDIPRGNLGLELGFAAITGLEAGPTGGIRLTTTDLNRHLTVEGKKARRKFPEWRGVLAAGRADSPPNAGNRAPGGFSVGERSAGHTGVEKRPINEIRRVCVDRKALARLLQAMDAAAPDPENSVFIELPEGEGSGLVLRARNAATGQSVVGLAMSTNTRGAWLELSEWERAVFAAVPRKTPVRKGLNP